MKVNDNFRQMAISTKVASSRLSHGSILAALLFLAIVAALLFSFFDGNTNLDSAAAAVLFSFLLNGLISLICLIKSIANSPFSLVQIHWLFYLTMFVLAPLSQYLYGYSAWGYSLSADNYLYTNILLLAWALIFATVCSVRLGERENSSSSSRTAPQNGRDFFSSLPGVTHASSSIALFLAICATLAVVMLVGVDNLFSRSDFSTGLDKATGLLFDKVVRPIPVYAFALILVRCKQQKKLTIPLIASFFLMLISNFPTAMARYTMACMYGGIALLAFDRAFAKKGVFAILFLLAFLIVLPAGNVYRYDSIGVEEFIQAISDAACNLPKGFCAVDYDAYSMIARTFDYVAAYGTESGYQFLGALLFFVPRALWISKPDGSGNLICAAQGQQQLNISCPLPAEGLLNFGVLGALVFAAAAAYLCKKGDRWFCLSSSFFRVFYPFIIFLLFFLMRGDLLSSFAYFVGYSISFVVFSITCIGPSRVSGWRNSTSSVSNGYQR